MATVDVIRALKRAERGGGGAPVAAGAADGAGGASDGDGAAAAVPARATDGVRRSGDTDDGGAGGAGSDGAPGSPAVSPTAADDLHIVGVGHSMGGCVLLLYVLHALALRREHGLSKLVMEVLASSGRWG